MKLPKTYFAPLLIVFDPVLCTYENEHVSLQSVDIYPKWATGVVGETQINCQVEFGEKAEMTWDFNDVYVYREKGGFEEYPLGTSKFFVHRSGMNFKLTVKNLKLEDGGKYMCISLTSEATAFLVVLDTPSIILNPPEPIAGETIMVTCQARFGRPRKGFLTDHYPNLKMYFESSSPNEVISTNETNYVEKSYVYSMSCSQEEIEPLQRPKDQKEDVVYVQEDELIPADDLEKYFDDCKKLVSLGPIIQLLKYDMHQARYFASWVLLNLTTTQPQKYCPMVEKEGVLIVLSQMLRDEGLHFTIRKLASKVIGLCRRFRENPDKVVQESLELLNADGPGDTVN